MKKIVVGIIGIGLISFFGCVSVNYDALSGEHFSYSRLGTQQIQRFRITKDTDGLVSVEFNNQTGGEQIASLFGTAMATTIKNLQPTNPIVPIVPK